MQKQPPSEHDGTATGWFVSIIAVLAMLAIACLVFSANTVRPAHIPSPHVKISIGEEHGSGVSIGDGYIITAAHVVTGHADMDVESDDLVTQTGHVLWANTDYDVALMRVPKPIPGATLNCSPVVVGERVVAHGNPSDLDFVFTTGVIAGGKRVMGKWPSAVPVSMPIIPGQSGGAITNEDGEIVGIAAAAMITEVGIAAMGGIIPSETICMLMDRR